MNYKSFLLLAISTFSFSSYSIDPESVIIYGHKDLELELLKSKPRINYINKRIKSIDEAKKLYGKDGWQLVKGKHAKRYAQIDFDARQTLSRNRVLESSTEENLACESFEELNLYTKKHYINAKNKMIDKFEEILNKYKVTTQRHTIIELRKLVQENSEIIDIAKRRDCRVYSYKSDLEVISFESSKCLEDTLNDFNESSEKINFDYQKAQVQVACSTKRPLFPITPININYQGQGDISEAEHLAFDEIQDYLSTF